MNSKYKEINISSWKALAIGLLLLLIRFYPFLLGKTIFFGDNFSLMVPGKIFSALWLRHGIIPFWNPYIMNGIPWVANINESVFYPSTLIFAVLNPAVALNVTTILHLGFTMWGMYALIKTWTKNSVSSWMAAILWVFSTQVTGSMNNLTTLQSIAWVPWVLLFSVRLKASFSSWLLLALCILGEVLGGYPQYVFYSVMAGFLLSCWFQRQDILTTRNTRIKFLLRWVGTGLLTLGLSAFVLMPFLQDLQASTRTIQTQMQSVIGSLNPMELIKVAIPYFFDNPAGGMKWGPSWNAMPNLMMYITWFGLLACGWVVLSKRRNGTDLFLGTIVAISLLFSVGDKLPGFAVLQTLLPFFKASRGPSLVLAITNALLIVWVADVFHRFEISNRFYKIIRNISGLVICLLIGAWLIIGSNFHVIWNQFDGLLKNKLSSSAFHTIERDQIIFSSITTNLIFNGAMLLVALILWKKGKYALFLLVIVVDMHINSSGMLFFAPNNVYPTWSQISESKELPELKIVGSERVLMSNFNTPYTDFGAYWEALAIRKPFSDSYVDEAELTDYGNLKRMRVGMTADWNMVYSLHAVNGYTSMVPQDFNAVWNAKEAAPAINNVSEIPLNHDALKTWGIKYYLVDTWFPNIPVTSLKDIYSRDLLKLYELSPKGRFQVDPEKIAIKGMGENPNELKVQYQAVESGEIVIADRFDPDWHAFVDGREVELVNRDGLRVVSLPQGEHSLVLRYIPSKFNQGLAITLVTVALASAIWYHSRRTKKLPV